MDKDLTDQVAGVAARVGLDGTLGGPVEIPPDLQRAMTFDSRGTVRA